MIITFQTANTGSQYAVLKPDSESKVKTGALTQWAFDVREETTGSLIETGDTVIDFNLRRDAAGQVNEAAYENAYKSAYGMVHLRSFKRGEIETISPTKEQMLGLPGPVLNWFYQRTQGVDWQEVAVDPKRMLMSGYFKAETDPKKAAPGEAE